MDRIDLRIEVPAVSADDLIRPSVSETSEAVAVRVAGARLIQQDRFTAQGLPVGMTNANCGTSLIEQIAEPDAAGKSLLHEASSKFGFSARAYHRVLRVARSLADLDAADQVGRIHLAEAISYRSNIASSARAAA